MVKQIWLNLPVKDVSKAKIFFTKIGFSFNSQQETSSSACMIVGENNFVVMLFDEKIFEGFVQNKVLENKNNSEILISIDAQSKQEVNDFAIKVKEAGGEIFSEPSDNQGWMYGFGFADLDKHRWNVLYMDVSKMNK